MSIFKIGDIVARKSYDLDILFKVVGIEHTDKECMVMLKGIEYRIQADAPESDLLLQDTQCAADMKIRQSIPARNMDF